MKKSIALVLSTAMFAAQGAAMLECEGLVTEKTPGWRFEASEAKGGQTFNPLEGWEFAGTDPADSGDFN